ncbi:MAG: hypothetical protein RLW62_02600 [Gammaproteobacteria bacterium]
MSLLNDPQQAALADLDAAGSGLLLRYGGLLESDIPPALRNELARIIETRRALLDRLARRERSRGNLPNAADEELNELRLLVDKLTGRVADPAGLQARVLRAEEDWLARVERARELAWHADEDALLARLEYDARDATSRLQDLRV